MRNEFSAKPCVNCPLASASFVHTFLPSARACASRCVAEIILLGIVVMYFVSQSRAVSMNDIHSIQQ